MSVSEEEKRGKIIILVIGYEQSSTRTKILSFSNAFPNASLTSCLALEPISSLWFKCQRRNWLWSSSSFLKYWQSSQRTTASPLASKVAESPCFAAGSTQDIMQKTEAACPQGKGQVLLLPGDDFRSFMEYIFLMILLGSSWDLSLLHNVISSKCCVQMYRSFTVGQYGNSVLVKQSPGCSSRLQITFVVER